MEQGKKRLATLVGCNYFNTRNELHGCINDVASMNKILVERFGFEPDHIEVLTDVPGAPVMPTGANIRLALRRMVDRAEPGDVLFFHYSGHGTLIPAVKSHHGRSKRGEAIVPCDFNLVTDVDFRQLVDRLPPGVSFTIISDSCHSGGLIDKEKQQIGPTAATDRTAPLHRPKTIPFDEIMQHVVLISGIESEHIGDHLLDIFGADASAKFSCRDLLRAAAKPINPDNGILLSGCQMNETSADMSPEDDGEEGGNGGKAYGAFSNAVQLVLKEEKGRLSNRELVLRARELLHKQGFSQHPCLYCSDENAEAPFLWQPEEGVEKI